MRLSSRRVVLTCVLAAVAVSCSDRELRPLTPCTTAGVSQTVRIDDVKNVDLLFMIDNSNSMREEQNKLRAEFPRMVRALVTGDIDGDGQADGANVESLRIAVVTSDMGVGGIGTQDGQLKVGSCLGTGDVASQALRANYGDDGIMRRQTTTVTSNSTNPTTPVVFDCDADGDGNDDVIASGVALPSFLTFPNTTDLPNDAAGLDEYVRRVSCVTNVGVTGCAFEQQLEAVLKAVTPRAETAGLIGGPFHAAPGDEATRSLGHGDDANTNGAWFRDDSLLAVVMVTDEDDCSAHDPLVFDSLTADPTYADPFGALQAQTRCQRFESEFVHDVSRYVQSLRNRRAGREQLFVFAAITGVPPDLTDEGDEGSDNLEEILLDERMDYVRLTTRRLVNNVLTDIPDGELRPACTHLSVPDTFVGSADVTTGSDVLANFTVTTSPTRASFTGTGYATQLGDATVKDSITLVSTPGFTPTEGMSISGPHVPPGTLIVTATPQVGVGPYTLRLSAELTGATPPSPGAPDTFTFNASFGPGIDMEVVGPGVDSLVRIEDVTGTGPYTVTLSEPVTSTATGAAFTVGILDVRAVPSRRIIQVADGLAKATLRRENSIIQSICVDSFAPAMERILRQIQANLAGSCLPRALIRGATNEVNCDVFVTLPPNMSCDDPTLRGAYTFLERVQAPPFSTDGDGRLERCVVSQLPVRPADLAAGALPAGFGWFYDDYTSKIDACGSQPQRISFATGVQPPTGAKMDFGCAQPVQDGELVIDIASACNGDVGSDVCLFADASARDDFVLRYNLPRSFDWNIAGEVAPAGDFICEHDTNTCQIRCDTDADCPGGFVCYDDPGDIDAEQGRSQRVCVNPTCGAD